MNEDDRLLGLESEVNPYHGAGLSMRDTIRLVILIGSIIAFCIFFAPGYQGAVSADGKANELTSTIYMGFPLSPWWEYKRTTVDEELIKSVFQFIPNSQSWGFLIGAIVLLALWFILTRFETRGDRVIEEE